MELRAMRKSMEHLSCCLLPGQMSGFKSLWEDVCLELSSPSSRVLWGGISGTKLLLAGAAAQKGGFLLLKLHEPRGFCRRMLSRASPSTGQWELGTSLPSKDAITHHPCQNAPALLLSAAHGLLQKQNPACLPLWH